MKITYETRRIPGIHLDGDLEPHRDSRLRRRLFELAIAAYPCAGGRRPYWCIPSRSGPQAEAICQEMARPHDRGPVFVDYAILEELSQQRTFDSQFGDAFLVDDPVVEAALLEHGLAEKETRGGLHRTDNLLELIKSIEWE